MSSYCESVSHFVGGMTPGGVELRKKGKPLKIFTESKNDSARLNMNQPSNNRVNPSQGGQSLPRPTYKVCRHVISYVLKLQFKTWPSHGEACSRRERTLKSTLHTVSLS